MLTSPSAFGATDELASGIGNSSPPSVLRILLASTSSWNWSSALRLSLSGIELSLSSTDRWPPSRDEIAGSPSVLRATLPKYSHFRTSRNICLAIHSTPAP